MLATITTTTEKQKCIVKHLLEDPTLSERQIARLCDSTQQYVNWLRKKLMRELHGPSKIEEKKKEYNEEVRDTKRYAGPGTSEAVRALGKDYAETIEKLSEKRSWFTNVLVDLGFESILMAFQFAKIDPKDIPRKVEEFNDPEEFKRFVRKYLTAMLESSTDATNAILERDKKIKQLENALKVAAALFWGVKRRVEELSQKMNIAETLISRYGLQDEYMQMLVQADIIQVLTNALFEPAQSQTQTQKATAEATMKQQ
jgi:predicted mannosyl-3-phosphoglycerate phosphatase (HAD superfamily)